MKGVATVALGLGAGAGAAVVAVAGGVVAWTAGRVVGAVVGGTVAVAAIVAVGVTVAVAVGAWVGETVAVAVGGGVAWTTTVGAAVAEMAAGVAGAVGPGAEQAIKTKLKAASGSTIGQRAPRVNLGAVIFFLPIYRRRPV